MTRYYTIKFDTREIILVTRTDPPPPGHKWPTKRVSLPGKTLKRRYADELAALSARALSGGRTHSVTRRNGVYHVSIEEDSLAAVADGTAALHASSEGLARPGTGPRAAAEPR